MIVAGYGNPLRGDDAVGWHVARALGLRWGPRVTVLTAHQPLPEWTPILSAARWAFFVDASVASARIRVQRVEPSDDGSLLDGHALDAARVLRLTRELCGNTPEAYLVHVPVECLDFADQLSPRATAAVQRAVTLLNRRLRELLEPPHQCS